METMGAMTTVHCSCSLATEIHDSTKLDAINLMEPTSRIRGVDLALPKLP